MKYKLVGPSLIEKRAYEEYIEEWVKSEEKIIPSSADPKDRSFDQMLKQWDYETTDAVFDEGLVKATIYFLVDEDDRICGSIHLRHDLNENLKKIGGHIGYGVRPSERRKGLATKMLEMMLKIVKKDFNIDKALLTCDKSNQASAKTIKSCSGVLENEMMYDGRMIQRYWITL